MMRRDTFLASGGYRKSFLHAEDYDLWLRLAESHQLANLPDVLLRYRFHATQIGSIHAEQQAISALGVQLAAKIRREGKPDPMDDGKRITREFLLRMGMNNLQLDQAIAYGHIGHGYTCILCGIDPKPAFDHARSISADHLDHCWVETQITKHKAIAFKQSGQTCRLAIAALHLFLINPAEGIRILLKRFSQRTQSSMDSESSWQGVDKL
jgi:hypothetical protein